MKLGILYKATNKINGKCYIGQTVTSLCTRKNKHFNAAFGSDKSKIDIYFYNAIRKYGKENFKWEVIAKDIPIDQLNLKEMKAIRAHFSFGKNGYNSNEGGGGNNGFKHNEETKRKLAVMKIGVHPSEETKRKLSAVHMGNKSNTGRRLSEEQKRKISLALSGRTRSEEWNRKNSEAHKGKIFSEDHRKNISIAKKGTRHTAEWKRRHSLAMSGDNNPNSAVNRAKRCQVL